MDKISKRHPHIYKVIISIFATLILALIAFVANMLPYLFQFFIQSINLVFSGFSNFFYRSVSNGDIVSSYLYILGFLSILTFEIVIVKYIIRPIDRKIQEIKQDTKKENNRDTNLDKSESKIDLLLTKYQILIGILLIFLYLGFLDYRTKVIVGFQQSIEILAPYMGTENSLKIKSEFASMKNSQDFHEIQNKLNNLSKKNNITLPSTISNNN